MTESAVAMRNSHNPHCLGCGPKNKASLGLDFQLVDDRMFASATLDERFVGAPGFVHGGAIATMFDDTFSALLFEMRIPAVTAQLNVNYRSPVFLERRLQLECWVERADNRKWFMAGRMTDEDRLIADSDALWVTVGVDHFMQRAGEEEGSPDMSQPEQLQLPW